jgi:hypothetical protein
MADADDEVAVVPAVAPLVVEYCSGGLIFIHLAD